MSRNPLYAFLWRVLLWMPGAFFVWYQLGTLLTWPVAVASRWLMTGFFPGWIVAIEQPGRRLDVVTAFAPPAGPADASLVFELNPLIYGYSVPLLIGLTLGVRGLDWGPVGRMLLGVLLLVPVQVWGVCFEILKTLAFNLGPGVSDGLGLQDWQYEGIALGYQFGYLILPAITPVGLWILFHRDFVQSLTKREEPVAGGSAQS